MPKTAFNPGAMLAPIPPAMVSCGTLEKPNIITIAWTGMVNSNPPVTYISIRPQRHSYGIIRDSGEFVINLTTEKLVFEADYCGIKSGKIVDKFSKMKLDAAEASVVKAPVIKQSPVNIECKVRQIIPFGTHDMFLADIVAVLVDDAIIDSDGRVDFGACGLAAFAHGEYFALGKKLGSFGYSVRKKKGRR